MDGKRPKTLDLKIKLEPAPELLQLLGFHSPLAVRITPINDGPCSAHTIPATPNF